METFSAVFEIFQQQLQSLSVIESTLNDFEQKISRFVFHFEYSAILDEYFLGAGRRVSLVMYNVRAIRE